MTYLRIFSRCRRRLTFAVVGVFALASADMAAAKNSWTPENLGVSAITGVASPVDGVVGVDGKVWSISKSGTELFKISTRSLKGSKVERSLGLKKLPDQGQVAVDGLGRVVVPARTRSGWGLSRTTVDGKTSVVLLPKSKVKMGPSGITDLEAGPDGSVWFATTGAIGRVNTQGKVFAWKVPSDRGYPANVSLPRLAVAADGKVAFTALNGVGRVSSSGVFEPWQKVSSESSTELSFLVRGGDGHLWATGGTNDDRLYREEDGGNWSRTSGRYITKGDYDVFFEALSPDDSGVLVIGASSAQEDDSDIWIGEWFLRGGANLKSPVAPTEWSRVGDEAKFVTDVLGPTDWGSGSDSPRRLAIVSLPDGRIWVSLRDWDGWESYNKQWGTRKAAAKGKLVGLKVKRRGRVVTATARCVGPTTGWCTGTLKTSFKGDVKRASLVIPAGPEAVRSTRTASVKLLKGQAAVLNRGKGKLVARVGSFKKRVK